MDHSRWFRRLLKLLPSDFQADYAREMERTFQAQRRDARGMGRLGVAALWWDTLRDLLRTAPREHMEQMAQDARYAVRLMRRAPGFTAIAIATLALGIGADSAIFSVVDAVILRPLPYGTPDRIVRVHERHDGYGLLRNMASPPNVLDWKQQSDVFSAIAAYRPRSTNVSGRGEPRYVQASRVTREFFGVLGVQPALGRTFTEREERGVARVVVISHSVWQSQFGADPSAIGRTIDLDGEPFEVLGVMPPGFEYQLAAELFRYQLAAELWLPLGLYPNPRLPSRGSHNLSVVARLRDGVSVEQAQAQMSAIAARLSKQYPATNKDWDVFVEPLHESVVFQARAIGVILVAAVGFVLLVTCANIGGLLVARASARAREFGVRVALGANRARLVRQLLTESLLLAGVGGVLGAGIAALAVRAVRGMATAVPRLDEVVVDGRTLVATAAISMLAGILFGLAPAWHVGRWDLHRRASEGGRSGSGGRERRALQSWLSAAQVAIAIVLLAGAGIMVRTLLHLNAVDPGFRAEGVLAIDLSLSDARYPTTEDALRFFERVVDAAAVVPGARSAALVSDPPLFGGASLWMNGFTIVGRPPAPPGEGDFAFVRWVTPRYFETLGLSIRRGRMISNTDRLDRLPVVVVNQAFADRYFPGEDALGRQIAVQFGTGAPREVVGVVANLHQAALTEPPEPQMYVPYNQGGFVGYGTLLVRTEGDPLALTPAVQAAVRSVDTQQPIHNIRRLEDIVAASVAPQRLTARALALFAVAALALAALGVYGVMAYSVRQRTQEIGVRVALGATRSDVVTLIVGDGLRLAAIGAVAGLAGALAATRLLDELLYGVSPSDPLTLAAVVITLMLSSALASFVPAWRATRVDPSVALRAE